MRWPQDEDTLHARRLVQLTERSAPRKMALARWMLPGLINTS